MSDQSNPQERWQKVSAALKQSLPEDTPVDEQPPPGFSTRVVARSREEKPFSLSSWSRPYLTGAALLTILGAGFGIGRLIDTPEPNLVRLPVPSESLALEMEESLNKALMLSEEQRLAIAPDLAGFNSDVIDNRRAALFHYYRSLLTLHDQIEPKLDPRQQEILRRNKSLLLKEIEQRFPDQPPLP